jgi:DNA-binding MarR family transcriptional regulator
MEKAVEKLRQLEEWYGFWLNQAADLFRTQTYAAVRESKFRPKALGLMLVVADQPGIAQSAVAARIHADRTTTSSLVEQLVKAGYLTREPDPIDRRNNRLTLTSKGHRCVVSASESALDVENKLLARLTVPEQDQLMKLLKKLLRQ